MVVEPDSLPLLRLLTQTEIAKRLNVSQTQVSRVQRAALFKLRLLLADGYAPQAPL